MRRIALFSTALALVFSLAAPTGAAFAFSEQAEVGETTDLTETMTSEDIEVEAPEAVIVPTLSLELAPEPALPPSYNISSQAPLEPLSDQDDLPAPPPVVIAQIQVGAQGNASDEYVSIYNNGAEAVDVTGWCLRNKNSKSFACLDETDVDYSIGPGAYIGFSSVPDRPGEHGLVVPFMAGSNHIVASGDIIQLIQGETVIDEIAWTASPPSGHYAIERAWMLAWLVSYAQVRRRGRGRRSWRCMVGFWS